MCHHFFKFIIFLSIFTIYKNSAAMVDEPHKKIPYQGKQRYLMSIILECQDNMLHPFSQTPIIRKEGNTYTDAGDILDLNEEDFTHIRNVNYVYLHNHSFTVTRLNRNNDILTSILVIGTNNKEECLKLQLTSEIDNKYNENYKSKLNNHEQLPKLLRMGNVDRQM